MANRKSIKNYDVIEDITGQEDDIALVGYKISNGTTTGVLASALAGSGSPAPKVVFDVPGDPQGAIYLETYTPESGIPSVRGLWEVTLRGVAPDPDVFDFPSTSSFTFIVLDDVVASGTVLIFDMALFHSVAQSVEDTTPFQFKITFYSNEIVFVADEILEYPCISKITFIPM